jgi:hypothetical protein
MEKLKAQLEKLVENLENTDDFKRSLESLISGKPLWQRTKGRQN